MQHLAGVIFPQQILVPMDILVLPLPLLSDLMVLVSTT